MGGITLRRLSLAMVAVMAVLVLFPVVVAAARTSPHAQEEMSSEAAYPSCTTMAAVVWTAQQLCGGAPVEDALLAVGLQPGEAVGGARALASLGLRTALDLRLLGRDAQLELDGELKATGLSLGDRAKVQLLVGDQEHLARLDFTTKYHVRHSDDTSTTPPRIRSWLQAAAPADSGGEGIYRQTQLLSCSLCLSALRAMLSRRTVRGGQKGH